MPAEQPIDTNSGPGPNIFSPLWRAGGRFICAGRSVEASERRRVRGRLAYPAAGSRATAMTGVCCSCRFRSKPPNYRRNFPAHACSSGCSSLPRHPPPPILPCPETARCGGHFRLPPTRRKRVADCRVKKRKKNRTPPSRCALREKRNRDGAIFFYRSYDRRTSRARRRYVASAVRFFCVKACNERPK